MATAPMMMAETSVPAEEMLTAQEAEAVERIRRARALLGDQVVILAHHYQRDSVVQFADWQGDSYQLAVEGAKVKAGAIVFAGVHFMAESAVVLGRPDQVVILPNLGAGCSLAEMASLEQVQLAWDALGQALGADPARRIMPITYMNSAASLKAFVGERGGVVCTSSNARGALEWAFAQRGTVFFFPDQHLGRNTARRMGIPLEYMALWDPLLPFGGLTEAGICTARIILWKGHCSVHQQFLPEHVDQWRRLHPDIRVIVHPECAIEVVDKADDVGSTAHIVRVINDAPAGSKWAVGTEMHLVNRLRKANPDKFVRLLSPFPCVCSTMARISPPDVADVLEGLLEGRIINRITVPEVVQRGARLALDRMLAIPA